MPTERLHEPWRSFLRDLDEELNVPTELHCFGGFVVAECYGLTRATADIDILESRGTTLTDITRLRHAMKDDAMKLDGIVEVDETYIGGPRKRKPGRPAPTDRDKTPVLALVERGGRARAFPMERVTGENVQQLIRREVSLNAHMMSDDLKVYHGLSMGFRKHDIINHTRESYVRGNVHTNTVEGFFGLLKCGIVGSFHHVSRGHLGRYVDEFSFRYNARTMSDGERAALLVAAAEGKRLTYQQPKDSPDASANA